MNLRSLSFPFGLFLFINLLAPLLLVQANSIWGLDDQPSATISDANPNELGTKFVSDTDGFIVALRFYKVAGSTGGEVGRLWSEGGAELASATYLPATSTAGSAGWRLAILDTPVAVTAGDTYIVSYNTVNVGGNYYYGASNNFFTGATTTSGALSAFNTNVSANGLYNTVAGLFPNQSFQGTAYFADVVFLEDLSETDEPEVVETNISNNQTDVSPYTDLVIRFDEIISTSSIAGATITFTDADDAAVPYNISYDQGRYELTISPQSTLLSGEEFTLTIESSGGPQDLAGNELTADYVLAFTTAAGDNCPCSIWGVDDLPTGEFSDGSSLELGTKFESSEDGYVTAIRFYRSLDSKGGEIGRLWTEGGVELASTTLVVGTTTTGVPGWYEARLDSPVAINAGDTYVVSYSTANTDGVYYYSATPGYFVGNSVENGALLAYANETKSNGVFGTSGNLPNSSAGASYFVDVVFIEDLNETFLPSVSASNPLEAETGVSVHKTIRLNFNEAIATSTVGGTSITLEDEGGNPVSIDVSYNSNTYELSVDPDEVLLGDTEYTLTLERAGGLTDIAGNLLDDDFVLTFDTEPVLSPGAGGPILLLYSEVDGFSQYYKEILRAEGFTAFSQIEISNLSSSALNSYTTVIVGAIDVNTSQASLLSDWVEGGGNLILMRPETDLRSLAGVTVSGTQSEGYLLIATSTEAGAGLVEETIQYHGVADTYSAISGQTIASLYQSSTTPAGASAVTLRSVGGEGGQVATFAFDLARSVIYSRQGNPDNAGLDVNNDGVPRSNDLFHPDYVDLDKVAIPQADELQRLFANLIITMSADAMPVPRFWYLPHMYKVAIMMTIDDHDPSTGETETYFDNLLASSTPGCSLDDWECYRATLWTYVTNGNQINDAEAADYLSDGFEIGVHVRGPAPCSSYALDTYRVTYAQQLFSFSQLYPSLPDQLTHRYHCIVWSDWTGQVEVMYENGIRLDMNYYYWPDSWVLNRPGYFTGSGFPMRYANIDGFAHNVYQSPTQLVNENGLSYPEKAQEMIDLALGEEGYYGILGTHGDVREDGFEDFMLDLAYENDIPLVTAEQVLEWTDARNDSTYGSMDYSEGILSFTLDVANNSDGLMVMLPTELDGETLLEINMDESAYAYATETIKGIEYAIFSGVDGDYEVAYTYTPDETQSTESTKVTSTRVVRKDPVDTIDKKITPADTGSVKNCINSKISPVQTMTEQFVRIHIIDCMEESGIIDESMSLKLKLSFAEPALAPYRFSNLLRFDMTGSEVQILQRFYNMLGIFVSDSGPGSPGQETLYFGPLTENATKVFQQTYADEILVPAGVTSPTGIFSTYSIQQANKILSN